MRRITVINHVSLDGVMQAPARPDEDTRDGFEHGGWATARSDEVMGRTLGEHMARSERGTLLLGRRTYQDFCSVWPARKNDPIAERLERTLKYVASNTLSEPLPWANSVLLHGDVPRAVAELKGGAGEDIGVLGSGELIQSLLRHRLIDSLLLLIHPVVIGSGRRLFTDGLPMTEFGLVDQVTTTTGVIIASYERGAPT